MRETQSLIHEMSPIIRRGLTLDGPYSRVCDLCERPVIPSHGSDGWAVLWWRPTQWRKLWLRQSLNDCVNAMNIRAMTVAVSDRTKWFRIVNIVYITSTNKVSLSGSQSLCQWLRGSLEESFPLLISLRPQMSESREVRVPTTFGKIGE